MLEVEELTKCRNDYLIAFGSIGFCSIVLRIVVYFIERPSIALLTTHIYIITTSSIYYFFIFPTFHRKCKWIQIDEETHAKYTLTTVVSHTVLMIISCMIATGYEEMRTIIFYQIGCSLVSAITFAEFARVLWVGVQLIDVNGRRNVGIKESVGNAKPDPNPLRTAKIAVISASSCKICLIRYTENGIHTPRIIKECGHTVCEQCAVNLLKLKKNNLLVCPFCRKATVVNGPVKTLPKNYALLEQMAEMQ